MMLASTEPLAKPEELACPHCHKFACRCEQDVCNVCRRHALRCICRSHVDFAPVAVDSNGDMQLGLPNTPSGRIEAEVRQALHHHYDTRDAAALERQVRRLATAVYRA